MKRRKEKTTILIVNKSAQPVKPIQISTGLLLHWKKYLAILSLIFFSLLVTIFYLASNKFEQNKLRYALSKTIYKMQNSFKKVDTSTIRKRFTKIDNELLTINGFLKARGIPAAFKLPQGGEAGNDIISPEELSDFYEKYLNKVIYNISYTPLGLPFTGAITSTFGTRENPFDGSGVETHKGLDIRGPIGAPVKAMAKGQVLFAGERGGFGNCIILKHGNGYETLYGHLSKILVRPGQKIDIGQRIGDIGSTGRSTGPHLHYEIHRDGQKINPASYLTLN
ncbi:MAG: M23 family metallopeptidase [Bacteroidota bacterium]|nr:M23 family metallopeptidase [Bacteroidota bacterium]